MLKFKAVRVAALLIGGSAIIAATPLLAQAPAQGQQPAERKYELSKAEQAALGPLITANNAAAIAAKAGATADWAAVRALLPAALAAAKSPDARYIVARVQFDLALGTNDLAAQEQAIAALLANTATPPTEAATYRQVQSTLVNKRAEAAFAANDFATAERLYQQLLQSNPGDQRVQTNLRIVQERMGNSSGALQGLIQQIQTAEAAGQRAPEDVYRRAWEIPYRNNQRAEAAAGLQRLLAAYPTPRNWRTAIDFVRERGGSDAQSLLDIYRLARTAGVIKPDEYLALAVTLDQAGLPGETKAVIDAGVAAGALQASQGDVSRLLQVANRRIVEDRAGLASQVQQARAAANGRQARIAGDVLFGYGRYAEAAEMYRLALTKGGEDAGMVNTRLGATLALAGQRAEAEAALKAVTGPRAELAGLWLAWLGRPAA